MFFPSATGALYPSVYFYSRSLELMLWKRDDRSRVVNSIMILCACPTMAREEISMRNCASLDCVRAEAAAAARERQKASRRARALLLAAAAAAECASD